VRICFIVAPQNKNTILDRIAHEIGKGFDESIYCYDMFNIPRAEHYFVTHYSLLPNLLSKVNPDLTPVTCFFTHNKGWIEKYVDSFNLCHSVVAESPEGQELMISIGVNPEIVHFVAEGGDNERFKPHERTDNGAILVCGTNYEDGRKNPELVYSVEKLLPTRLFKFVGKNWKANEFDYKDYPSLYSECSVYLSCSKLEGGGPNSLIEAMHANLVPVVSDTGNARQYIQHGYNGFIFGHDATPEYIASLIERAYKLKPQNEPLPTSPATFNDVWQSISNYTWDNYSLQMKEIITGDYSKTASQGDYAYKPE
jgi:glycosyltransferase involved in cell wall biosynthesis